jgi:hypothetical protein
VDLIQHRAGFGIRDLPQGRCRLPFPIRASRARCCLRSTVPDAPLSLAPLLPWTASLYEPPRRQLPASRAGHAPRRAVRDSMTTAL